MSLTALWQSIGSTPALVMWAAGPRSSFGFEGVPGGWGVALKALLPIVGFVVVAPVLWWFFRGTWRELDVEADAHRAADRAAGRYDYRPIVCCALAAIILTMQEYYGGRSFYYHQLRPWLRELELAEEASPGGLGQFIDLATYSELYGFGWWALTRVGGYVFVPLAVWKLLFRHDSLVDMAGLRVRGLLKHAWIYGACLVVVVPLVFVVAQSPDFAAYYPFYKKSSRSWLDLVTWEALYIAQFFALEVYFRGFWLQALRRSLGSGAIFAMCVPYVMIHYGKPYLESCGAFIAGVALGSLAMRTRNIYSGFMVHVTVALLMDLLGILGSGGLPTRWSP